jgi:hypothetical protein
MRQLGVALTACLAGSTFAVERPKAEGSSSQPSFLRQSVYWNPHEEAGSKQLLEDCSEEPLFM